MQRLTRRKNLLHIGVYGVGDDSVQHERFSSVKKPYDEKQRGKVYAIILPPEFEQLTLETNKLHVIQNNRPHHFQIMMRSVVLPFSQLANISDRFNAVNSGSLNMSHKTEHFGRTS